MIPSKLKTTARDASRSAVKQWGKIACGLALIASAAGAEVIRPMDRTTARERAHQALADSALVPADLDAIWDRPVPAMTAVIESLALSDERARESIDQPLGGDSGSGPAILRDEKIDSFLRNNLAVYLASVLVRAERFDEALQTLEGTSATDIVDPAEYYFALAVCQYHLGKRDDASQSISLLTQVEGAPERYLSLASLMAAALARMKPDSLDALAIDMRDVRRRLEHGRTDKTVRDLEDDLLNRLNQMIAKLEEQQQQQQNNSEGGNQLQPNAPAPDSRPMGGSGEGKVDEKQLRAGKSWGNLPPKEREKALQEIGRDLPGHYRDAIEQYFRKLAETPQRSAP